MSYGHCTNRSSFQLLITCLHERSHCSLRDTPDLQTPFLPFEPLKVFFTVLSEKGARVKLTASRVAFLLIVALIVVAQGSKGSCAKVARKGDEAEAALRLPAAETQHLTT